MRRIALAMVLLLAPGCASHTRRAAPTAAVPPPPSPGAGQPAGAGAATGNTTSRHAGGIAAPWDTAGTASGKAARRNHVYPSGPNALGRRLVDSLPDPASMARGAKGTEPAKPEPLPVNDRACWEVQVLVTTSESRAREETRHLEKALDLAAWVRTEGAIYRVRVGGCLTADGAGELAQRLHLAGYPEAFRVMREP